MLALSSVGLHRRYCATRGAALDPSLPLLHYDYLKSALKPMQVGKLPWVEIMFFLFYTVDVVQ